jgi:hypothetical protein
MASTTNSVSAEQREAERRRSEQKLQRRSETVRRIKDIGWSAVIGSAATLIVVTSLGWLTTQSVVTAAREQGAHDLVALRSGICVARFQQLPGAVAKLAELKALGWDQRTAAAIKLVTDEKLAIMLGETAPAVGAIDACAAAIRNA